MTTPTRTKRCISLVSNEEKHYKVKFKLTPHKHQQEIISYILGNKTNPKGKPYKFFIAAIGRQWGKSWLAKYLLLEFAINRKKTCLWVSPAFSTARAHWNELLKWIEGSGIPVKKITVAAREIQFYGGGSITVRSAMEPDNLRGMSIDFLVADEAAFYRDGEYVWMNVLLPMLTATNGIAFFPTTPNGRNWLFDLFERGMDPNEMFYRSWNMPSSTSPYQSPELLAELKKSYPEYRWKAEFEAIFLSDAGGVFSGADRVTKGQILEKPQPGGVYVAGIDIGFKHDYSVVSIIDQKTMTQVFGYRFNNDSPAGTIATIVNILSEWRPRVTVIEKNGMGIPIVRMFQDALSGNDFAIHDIQNVVGHEFDPQIDGKLVLKARHVTDELKVDMVDDLAAAIEYGRITLLSPDSTFGRQQANELSTFTRNKKGKKVVYEAEIGAYDDTVSALYLAFSELPKPTRVRRVHEVEDAAEISKNPFRGRGKRLKGAKAKRYASRN